MLGGLRSNHSARGDIPGRMVAGAVAFDGLREVVGNMQLEYDARHQA